MLRLDFRNYCVATAILPLHVTDALSAQRSAKTTVHAKEERRLRSRATERRASTTLDTRWGRVRGLARL
jgi:hypothetical protein